MEDSPARFKVLVVGRRSGKTHYGIWKCLKGALNNPGNIYWWVGPIYPISDIGWRILKRQILFLQNNGIECRIREDPRWIEFPNGAQIWVKSADNPDSLRGEGLSGVVLDEAAQIKESAWSEVLGPSLADKQGWALFITTPKGKNWIYPVYKMAETDSQWAAWKLKTRDINPYIQQSEIDYWRNYYEVRGQLNVFFQEWEADFGASQFLVYPTFDSQVHKWARTIPEFSVVRGGLDFGGTSIGSHKSAGCVAIVSEADELIFVDEFEQAGPNIADRQMAWMWDVEQKIREISFKSKRPIEKIIWHADKTQMVGIQLMRGYGFTVIASKGGPDSVVEGISLVSRRLWNNETNKPNLYYRDGLRYIPEAFERYRYPEPTSEDKPLVNKPLKVNDDMMDALRYCVEGLDRSILGDPALLYQNALPSVS